MFPKFPRVVFSVSLGSVYKLCPVSSVCVGHRRQPQQQHLSKQQLAVNSPLELLCFAACRRIFTRLVKQKPSTFRTRSPLLKNIFLQLSCFWSVQRGHSRRHTVGYTSHLCTGAAPAGLSARPCGILCFSYSYFLFWS